MRGCAVLVLLLAACPAPPLTRCNVDTDCIRGERCTQGICVVPADDADAGSLPDAGLENDAGTVDDAGSPVDDAGPGEGEGEDNSPPSIASVTPLRTRATSTVDVELVATDPDGDAVAFEIVSPPTLGTASASTSVSYTAVGLGDDVFSVRPVDARGLAGDAVDVSVHVLAEDWLDLALTSRTRVATVGAEGVNDVVPGVAVYVSLRADALGADFLAALAEVTRAVDRDGAVIAFDIDHADDTEVALWVRPPSVDARPNTVDFIDVYAGGSTSLDTPDSASAWVDFGAVYHLEPAISESTGRHTVVGDVTGAQSVPCLLGRCFDFDGVDDTILLATGTSDLASAVTATLSATVRYDVGSEGFAVGWSTAGGTTSRLFISNNPNITAEGGARTNDAAALFLSSGTPVPGGVEVRVDVVVDLAADIARLYVDGVQRASRGLGGAASFPSTGSSRVVIGSGSSGSGNHHDGSVDEVRISPLARDAQYVRVDALSRAALLSAAGPVER